MRYEMLQEVINEQWKTAYKAKNTTLKSTFESIKAKILVEEKSGRYDLPLDDTVIENIIIKEIKELKETQQNLIRAGRVDDAQEIDIKVSALEQYLPERMSEAEVISLIVELAKKESNKGKLIGLTVKAVGSKFDKSRIATLVNAVV